MSTTTCYNVLVQTHYPLHKIRDMYWGIYFENVAIYRIQEVMLSRERQRFHL